MGSLKTRTPKGTDEFWPLRKVDGKTESGPVTSVRPWMAVESKEAHMISEVFGGMPLYCVNYLSSQSN